MFQIRLLISPPSFRRDDYRRDDYDRRDRDYDRRDRDYDRRDDYERCARHQPVDVTICQCADLAAITVIGAVGTAMTGLATRSVRCFTRMRPVCVVCASLDHNNTTLLE